LDSSNITRKAYRPSATRARKKVVRKKPVGMEELARRKAAGLDLWTGEPLQGLDLIQWNRLEHGIGEEDLPENLGAVASRGLAEFEAAQLIVHEGDVCLLAPPRSDSPVIN